MSMHQVRLNDQLYKEAQRRAREAGFASVDEFIADRLENDFSGEQENFDHLFTPEVIADLDKISDTIKAGGKTYTMDEVDQHLEQKRQEWLRNHVG
jgi:hypothetical protein